MESHNNQKCSVTIVVKKVRGLRGHLTMSTINLQRPAIYEHRYCHGNHVVKLKNPLQGINTILLMLSVLACLEMPLPTQTSMTKRKT